MSAFEQIDPCVKTVESVSTLLEIINVTVMMAGRECHVKQVHLLL